jgi:ketosteroid isomerase-like protein
MSEQNKRQADVNRQVVEDFFRLFLEGDMDGLMACQTDDFVWDIASGAASGAVPWLSTCQGREAALALVETYERVADPEVFEVDEYYAEGDKVFALGREKVVSKSTGKSFETKLFYVATMREGKIAKLGLACDTAAAMAAFTPD